MAVFSHSKFSTFEQCRAKFKFKYIDRIKPEVDATIESHLGSCVHKTLEWLYLRVGDGRIPELDDVIVFYSNVWKADFDPRTPIVKQGMKCEDYFNMGVRFLVGYYGTYNPFDDNTIHVEKEITLDAAEFDGHKIRGFIDRIVYNEENDEIEIHDYKTSNSLPTKEKIDNDRQLGFYAIAVKEIFGRHKEVKLVWHYLSFNKEIVSRRTEKQLKNLKEKTKALIKEIQMTKDFPPNKSTLCDWCEYKSICPAWKNPSYRFERQKRLKL